MAEEGAPTPEQTQQIPEIVPAHPYHRQKLLFLIFAGAISIILLVVGGYQLIEFTDSTGFCGRLCHTVMYPEYTVYQASPHSRVLCAGCHVGPGAGYLVKSKLAGVPLIFATITGDYHRPIPAPVHSLRPARETCEQCHRPERFTGDFVVQHTTYAPDEKNTSSTDTRILRVGGAVAYANCFVIVEPGTTLEIASGFGALFHAWSEGPTDWAGGGKHPELFGF